MEAPAFLDDPVARHRQSKIDANRTKRLVCRRDFVGLPCRGVGAGNWRRWGAEGDAAQRQREGAGAATRR